MYIYNLCVDWNFNFLVTQNKNMTDNSNTIQIQNNVFESITNGYLKAIESPVTNATIKQNSDLSMSCNGPKCKQCLNTVIPNFDNLDDQRISDLVQKHTSKSDGICYDACTCSVENLQFINHGIVQMIQSQSSEDYEKIVKSIKTQLQKDHKITATDTDIRNIVSDINIEAKQNISQVLYANQVAQFQGTGYNVQSSELNIMTNAIMSAVQNSSSAQNIADELIQSYVQKIQKSVNKKFFSGFKQIWNDTKHNFFILLLIFGILLLVFLGLLILKPSK